MTAAGVSRRAILVLAAVAWLPVVGGAQPIADEAWTAEWIAHQDDPGDAFGVWHFRRAFTVDSVPDSFLVHVSADNRYRLFLNGTAVSEGPARGDPMHWRYETVDLAPWLDEGPNVLAAVVWNFAGHRPVAQMSVRTAFILQGPPGAGVDSGPDWRVARDFAYAPLPVTRDMVGGAYIVVGPGEEVDGSVYPWGWADPGFDDSAWSGARTVRRAMEHTGLNYGGWTGWKLVPRTIPPMEHRAQRFREVVRATGVEAPAGFVTGQGAITVPARTHASLLLDQGELTTAYPELVTSGGAGSRVTVTYAEALVDSSGAKRHRDRTIGMRIRGITDRFMPGGGYGRLFRPLWWRTFRYVQLDVETGDRPLTIERFSSEFTAYPFEEKARFVSSDSSLEAIWGVGWRTARLCAGETYFDCPYYEQLQYVGDTRIQALISLYVSGDDRLMRKAIELFDQSRIPEGLTQSRYPSRDTQFIAPYSLFWISMVHDYWMHRDDRHFVEARLNGIRAVVDWYAGFVDETGMVGPAYWWSFVDWSFYGGVPPGASGGHSSIVSLQYVYALRQAEELARAFGRPDDAVHYAALASGVGNATIARCWDGERGLVTDTPERTSFSQHASILGVISGAVPEADRSAVVERVLADTTLTPATFYFQFYLHRALAETGLADRYQDLLDPWRAMLDLGLTTFAEKPEPTRSDAHAWSASPNYMLLSLVCGIRPDSPGFRTVVVEPAPGPLAEVECAVPHPLGEIAVRLGRLERGGLAVRIVLPDGLTGRFVWKGRERALESGVSDFQTGN